jgi:hypothetical protein
MSRRFDRGVERKIRVARLGVVEGAYVRRAAESIDELTPRDRRLIVEGLIEHLGERPAAGALEELYEDLGSPADYAAAVRERERLQPVGVVGRIRAQPRPLVVAELVVLLGVVLGTWQVWTYYTEVPEFANGCSGVAATEFETLRAASTTELRITYRQDERLGLMVCPTTRTSGVTIERIYRPVPPRLAFQPVGTEVNTESVDWEWTGDASASVAYRPEDVPWGANVILWFEMEYCNTSGRVSVPDFRIDYRYRGRTRTATVLFGYQAGVDAGEQCTNEVRAADDAESAAWAEVTRARLAALIQDRHEVGPLRLAPESVSRDLCRYLRGVLPIIGFDGDPAYVDFEPLSARAVFQLDDDAQAEVLIDGAVMGICPEFADRRDELVTMLEES